MAYLAPIHYPTSVRHAIKLHFLSPEEESLVVAKNNRLEIYSQSEDGLVSQHTKAIYGKITMLSRLRPASSSTDHLFVGTDRYMYFVLSWDAGRKQLRTQRTYADQADKSARDSQTGDRVHIDPTGSFMTLELYEGVITLIPIVGPSTLPKRAPANQSPPEHGTLGEPISVRIPEMFVRSSTFFTSKMQAPKEKPKIALLYEDNYKRVKLRIREVDFSPGLSGEGPLAELPEAQQGYEKQLEAGASHLVPVVAPAHGFLILAETSILYYEASLQRPIRKPLPEATIFVAWEPIDAQRYVLADEYGKLYLLMLEYNNEGAVTGWALDVIGETSKAEVLIYLGEGRVFVGSHSGDSQVISIKPQAIDLVQTLPNIAPILDFTIMDMGNRGNEGQANEFSSGQARLVTGSGAFKDGSLRSVRSGVGLEDLGLLDQVENVTNMFSLKSDPTSDHVDTLIVSFVAETRVFQFSADGDVEELPEFFGLQLDTSTLFAGTNPSGDLVQVTQSAVEIHNLSTGAPIAKWEPPNQEGSAAITAVTSNSSILVAAVAGTRLYALSLADSLKAVSSEEASFKSQIACINIPRDPDSSLLFVGLWGSTEVSVLSLPEFSIISSASALHGAVDGKSTATVPRSLLLAQVLPEQSPILFVALADGTVVTFSCDPSTGTLTNPKSIVLGTQQADLRILPRADGLDNVLAIAEHASLVYGSEGRLTYSAVTAEDASVVAPFDAAAYPGAIAIAGPSGLRIAMVDEERSTHVQGLHVGETVRRIAHSPKLGAFGLGTISRTLEHGTEIVQSAFKLADEVTFAIQASYPLHEDELIESVMRCELDDGHGRKQERFVVGTAYIADDTDEAIRGRIVILEVTEDRQLKEICEQNVRGACRVLSMVDGKIVAALIKTVLIYTLEYATASTPVLVKSASYRTATAPISLTTHSDPATSTHLLAIGDLMKSLSIVQYKRGTAGLPDTLVEVARHFATSWATAVELVDAESNSYLQADAEGNLLVLRQDAKGVTPEDRRRLQVTSEMNISELVNRIQRIDVPVPASLPVVPRAFLATVEGSIHLFAVIKAEWQDTLMRLQGAIAEVVKSPGDVPFGAWRAFRNAVREESEPFRFVDGEVVEMFLELEEGVQVEVLRRAEVEEGRAEEMRGVCEGLRRLR